MNVEWAVGNLDWFIGGTVPDPDKGYWGGSRSEPVQMYGVLFDDDQIIAGLPAVEAVLDQVVSGWKDRPLTGQGAPLLTRWTEHREAAMQCRATLFMREEIEQNVGETAPDLSASRLHPWVWEAAKASWTAGFHTHAVSEALSRLNLETQRKGERLDLSEGDLFRQLFSVDDPKMNSPRLRLCDSTNRKTFESRHAGASNYASGLYSAVRNVLSHTVTELTEDEALELMAAVSVLARWVEAAKLDRGAS